MPIPDPEFWSALLRRTLQAYDVNFLRPVTSVLVRPRNQWPVEELIDRAVGTVVNPAVIDRRLKDLEPVGRKVLALIGQSRQPCWTMGNLVELVMALGHDDGLQPLRDLVNAGLLYPTSPLIVASQEAPIPRLRGFDQWLAGGQAEALLLFAYPLVAARAIGEDLGLPDLSDSESKPPSAPMEADGLEFPLRLAILWQQVLGLPLRQTQQGGFFKRDVDRLGNDPLLNAAPSDQPRSVADQGFLLAGMAEVEGILKPVEGDLRAGALPASWPNGTASMLEGLFAAWPRIRTWNPLDGWPGPEAPPGNPFPSASLLALLLLARLPAEAWARVEDLETWIQEHHPFWAGNSLRPSRAKPWLENYFLGVAWPLRLLRMTRDSGGAMRFQLSVTGRWLLGMGEQPTLEVGYPQTLTIQPNLEIIAFRQGLTPGLIAALSRFAIWKSLGAACTLQLEPESVYRALEAGDTFESIKLTLERHATRGLPNAVLDLLRTWSNKRDRITVYPAATLLEFESAADLNEALARGVPGTRIADHLAVLASETDIDYRHFRLTGTRDYALPPEKCVTVEPDGVTVNVDATRSDLLLETELPRFADPLPGSSGNGKRFRLSPSSLANARSSGLMIATLESWFHQRSGQPLPAAARLLFSGPQGPAAELQRHLVVHLQDEETADGLMQWPATRELIDQRLGPTTLSIKEENLEALRKRFQEVGLNLQG